MDSTSQPAGEIQLQQEAQTLLKLAETDRRSAELAFEKLGFDRQLETALALTGDELHEWLMLSGDLTELVRVGAPAIRMVIKRGKVVGGSAP